MALDEESRLGYEAAKLLEEEERRKEHQQLEEDRRVAELLTQEFLLQQIVRALYNIRIDFCVYPNPVCHAVNVG